MKKTLTFSDFCDEVRSYSDNYSHKFSYDGLRAIFDYFEELAKDTGEEIECDVIAFCCEYTEYDNLEDFLFKYYGEDFGDMEIRTLDDLRDRTTVILVDGKTDKNGIIVQEF
uniref:Uncharacterized protein n=1 Tax=viral metagenome TaxID=1070528 RepID=A0A6M3IY15_9ZZZZ